MSHRKAEDVARCSEDVDCVGMKGNMNYKPVDTYRWHTESYHTCWVGLGMGWGGEVWLTQATGSTDNTNFSNLFGSARSAYIKANWRILHYICNFIYCAYQNISACMILYSHFLQHLLNMSVSFICIFLSRDSNSISSWICDDDMLVKQTTSPRSYCEIKRSP